MRVKNKTKFINLRVSETDKQVISNIKNHYSKQGIKLNVSQVVRNVLVNFPMD
jgi:predicted DNA binding CopG/RHH family protein